MPDNNESEWKLITEIRDSAIFAGKKYEVTGIQSSDGFTVFPDGRNREKRQTFLVKGKFGEFRLEASRWDLGEEKPLDIYTVYTQSFDDDEIGKKNKALCLEYSKEIEYALMHLPVSAVGLYDGIPVKEVFFDIGKEWTDHVRVKAKDLGHAR